MGRLIVCCDGTWQSVAQHSNVSRLYRAIVLGGDAQAHYIPGVGVSANPLVRIEGGATGAGLSASILDGYRWLVEHYQQGDRVAVFGFSRGAYTARSLAGMIGRVGLVDGSGLSASGTYSAVHAAYSAYRDRVPLAGYPLAYHPGGPDIPVDFVGVWDTVGALGIPSYAGVPDVLLVRKRYEFLDVTLNPRIRHARHAVSLDELRGPFRPTLWADPAPGQDMRQVWFPGDHCDVGGGNPDKRQSDIALDWMMREATKAVGIGFDRKRIGDFDPDIAGSLHSGPTGLLGAAWEVAFQPRPRTIPRIDPSAPDPDIDACVYDRQRERGYRPTTALTAAGDTGTATIGASAGWTSTGLWLEPGTYHLTAAGRWQSGLEEAGPDGDASKWHLSGELFREVVGLSQALLREVAGNPDAALLGARREPSVPWMALIGVVANEHTDPHKLDANHKPQLVPAQCVLIGDKSTLTVPHGCGGYLYAFPNDAWGCYGNNEGSVELVVTRGDQG